MTSDVSAGMKHKKRSPPFQTNVSTRLGYDGNGNGGYNDDDNGRRESLKLVETLSWEQPKNKSKQETTTIDKKLNGSKMVGDTFFARSCPLGASMDIDAVDGSYSIHSHPDSKKESKGNNEYNEEDTNGYNSNKKSSCALPKAISGVDGHLISSIIEHCLVLSDNKRTRCFLLYGKNGIYGQSHDDEELEERLIRVVIANECKPRDTNSNGDASDLLKMIEEQSRPQIGVDNRLAQLSSVMGDQFVNDDEMKEYPVSMMSLSVGPWLGDLVVRDRSYNDLLPRAPGKALSKGFGAPKKSQNDNKKEASNGFGEFVIGVQKVAMQFSWDYGSKVKHGFEFGRSMGCYCENWPESTWGTIIEEKMSRRLSPEDRTMYIDYESGTYCGFIVGSLYVKVSGANTLYLSLQQ